MPHPTQPPDPAHRDAGAGAGQQRPPQNGVTSVPPVLPSGNQHVLVRGGQRAVVVEVGGGIRCYEVDGRAVLDGFGEHEQPTGARGQPLVPWPNRLRDGRYTWDGQEHQLALSEPETSNAIHGLLRWASWTTGRQSTTAVEMRSRLHPRPGYPFALDVAVEYRLTDDGLEVTTTARNVGADPLPYASGQHPYLASGSVVDECTLALEATTYLETDDRGLPVSSESVADSPFDFRSARQVGATELDHAFTDLTRDTGGRAWVRLTTKDGVTTGLWVDESYRFVQLFTGDSLPEPARRRRSLGVEPMTAPPNALADDRDVVRLEPGQQAISRWGLCLS